MIVARPPRLSSSVRVEVGLLSKWDTEKEAYVPFYGLRIWSLDNKVWLEEEVPMPPGLADGEGDFAKFPMDQHAKG